MLTDLAEPAGGLRGRLACALEPLREARVAGEEAQAGPGGNSLREHGHERQYYSNGSVWDPATHLGERVETDDPTLVVDPVGIRLSVLPEEE